MGVTRRQVMTGMARTAVGGGAVAGSAMVAAAEAARTIPEHVEIVYDEDLLATYQPMLDFSLVDEHPDDARPTGMYGWIAHSSEHETSVAVYWTEYAYQQGILFMGEDSHNGDHEPVYVEFDPDNGQIESVSYSAYHWIRGQTSFPSVYETTHPKFTVVSPWHQYAATSTEGEFVETVQELGNETDLKDADTQTTFEQWLYDDGMDEHLHPGSVVDPWQIVDWRMHWWRENSVGISTDVTIAHLGYALGMGGAGKSDAIDAGWY